MGDTKDECGVTAIREALRELMHADAVDAWMDAPNGALGGRRPADVAETDPDILWQIIHALGSGEPG